MSSFESSNQNDTKFLENNMFSGCFDIVYQCGVLKISFLLMSMMPRIFWDINETLIANLVELKSKESLIKVEIKNCN